MDAGKANDRHLTTTPPIELTNATGTRLDQLNEDCLMDIFSVKSLTPVDLTALAETCILFKRIAERVFPKTFTVRKDDYEPIASGHDVIRIFENFGRRLVSLSVYPASGLMILVAKYCVAGTLKELKIDCIKIPNAVAVELKPMFRQLQKLSIHRIIECGVHLFADCVSLVELSVLGYTCITDKQPYVINPVSECNFPKLQRFIYRSKHLYSDTTGLLKFLKRHTTLKCLRLIPHQFDDTMGYFIQVLGIICNDLEELEIEYVNPIAALDFSSFQSLRRLTLRGASYGNENLTIVRLQDVQSLQALEINGVIDIKEVLADLSLLKNFRELKIIFQFGISETVQWKSLPQQLRKLIILYYRHDNDDVLDIIMHLHNLEELEMNQLVMSKKVYYEIVNLTERRQNVLTLTCQFESGLIGSCKELFDENLKVKLIEIFW